MYPGIYVITRKNYLARNLMRMHKAFPDEYDFFPKTWVLPNDMLDLRQDWIHNNSNAKNSRKVTYIVKPDSMS
jgi:tubulin polyglutamylase TTLL6/13